MCERRGSVLCAHTSVFRQLTVQELSVMIRVGVKPIIFMLNNKGYTIERYLHGEKRKYNDITNWYSSSSSISQDM